jgi:hypothetical protein
MGPIIILQTAILIFFVFAIVIILALDRIKFPRDSQFTGVIKSFNSEPEISDQSVRLAGEKWLKIKSFSVTITDENPPVHLKIRSPVRPEPILLFRGDDVLMKGNLRIKVFPKGKVFYVNVQGVARSVKKNGKQYLPTTMRAGRDWLVALAAVVLGIVALISLLWNVFVKWSSP